MLLVALTVAACGLTGSAATVLERIVGVESGGEPLALNVNGEFELVRRPRSHEEAVAMASWLLAHGYNFDAGLAQVNSANFARLGLTAEAVFDPCTNLRAGLQVFTECQARAVERFGEGERAVTAALSCYNAGDFDRGLRNGYVSAVEGRGTLPGSSSVPAKGSEAYLARRAGDVAALGERTPDVFGQVAGR
jgi:type IV secretion system protein VirB1